ncbi:hypothetical protein JAAARDRAFT_50345 [Jaapia argillacea MUCL 33604]|uniref:Fungal-type protein kinase domain-containing protein n=1 Tax=Jaapia argillacea MUCL 33604 TaxID=933084 RepID=A0A067PBQ0_9AGAM|nr:hypothetical protein JAAARDRAFT_50345 [Jaapia argillacea MUCL 33604]
MDLGPEIAQAQTRTSTRGPADYDLGIPRDEQLQHVVYVDRLIDQLDPLARKLLSRPFDPAEMDDQVCFSQIHPWFTSRHLPSTTRSEHDSEDWVFSVLVRPAMEALALLQRPSNNLQRVPLGDFPNVSSAGGSCPIPDAIFVFGDRDDVRATIEIKTHKALLTDDGEFGRDLRSFQPLMNSWPNMPIGRATRFIWPSRRTWGSSLKPPPLPCDDKILIQVWSQMHSKAVDFAMLSSYRSTFFFHKQGTTLFISRPYTRMNAPVLATFTFLALACGRIPRSSLKLPEVDTQWYLPHISSGGQNLVGIDWRTTPDAYYGETVNGEEVSE